MYDQTPTKLNTNKKNQLKYKCENKIQKEKLRNIIQRTSSARD